MSIYDRDPNALPDSRFVPGTTAHLVPGSPARLLDSRRTPVSIAAVDGRRGFFTLRLEAFEEEGECWEMPLEDAVHLQFPPDAPTLRPDECNVLDRFVERFRGEETCAADPGSAHASALLLEDSRVAASAWLATRAPVGNALPDPETRDGIPDWMDITDAYLRERGLDDIDRDLTRIYVSNPYSGDEVLALFRTLARMGLVTVRQRRIRDAAVDAPGREARRREYLTARIGFVRALLATAGHRALLVFRGASSKRPPDPERLPGLVATTRSVAVATSHFDAEPAPARRVLVRRAAPVERVLWTYLETRAMNRTYREAEVVLFEPGA